MKRIYKYKVFSTSEDFEKWQIESANLSIQIAQLIPINNHILTQERPNLNMVGLADGSDVVTNIDTSLCVIYSEETYLIE